MLTDVVLRATLFDGALFSRSTALPFSEVEALRRGMLMNSRGEGFAILLAPSIVDTKRWTPPFVA